MKMILRFKDQSNSFSRGVEYGRIIEKMEKGQEIVDNKGFPVRIENKEDYINACNYYKYIPIFGDVWFDEWVYFTAVKNENLN